MTRCALIVALVLVGCGVRYGEMPRSYGDGTATDAGCWVMQPAHTQWPLHVDKARELLPECREFAAAYSKRIALIVTTRETLRRVYGDSRHSTAVWLRQLNAWAVITSTDRWAHGTQRKAMRHELLHVMGETHPTADDPGGARDFTPAQWARWGYGPGGAEMEEQR